MKKFNILLIEDEDAQREPIKGFLARQGYSVFDFASGRPALEFLQNNLIDLVLTDYKLHDMTGGDILSKSIEINPSTPVVIMTAYGSIEDAVGLMRSGAYHYIQKPIDLQELLHLIAKVNERQLLISENRLLRQQLEKKFNFNSIISVSGEMEEALNTAGRVADSKAGVLIRGESGTGKELIARAIHFSGNRKDKPFVVINCAALPETLFESELFGHEKGSFTGAMKQRIGKFEQADKGTLFIDEVGDIPLQVQVKLLRAIQFGQFERLGGKETINPDVRIIAATNRNLEELIAQNLFREDLFYRLNIISIMLPPLRKRKTDIPVLIDHFIKKHAGESGKSISSISREAMDLLIKHNFPGNVRELENIIQRAVILTRGDVISVADLPENITSPKINEETSANTSEIGDLNIKVEHLEIILIRQALAESGGNQVKAAKLLNISERTLRYKIQKYNILN